MGDNIFHTEVTGLSIFTLISVSLDEKFLVHWRELVIEY
jgi:hypothetical protein